MKNNTKLNLISEERGNLKGASKLLLKPRNTKEVSEILKICHQNKISLVPQGEEQVCQVEQFQTLKKMKL